jgi:hypothetical protein
MLDRSECTACLEIFKASGNAKICVRPPFLAAHLQRCDHCDITPQPLPFTWSLRPISGCDFAPAPPIDSVLRRSPARDVQHLDRARRAG